MNYNILPIEKNISVEYSFKIVIVGESGVGKTSILKRELNNEFSENIKQTSTFEHYYKNYSVNDSKICLHIWDTCGKDNYRTLVGNFLRASLCAFLVFSIDNIKSFEKLSDWILEIKENCSDNIILFLIGNKKDKLSERKVSFLQINNFIKEENITKYFEISALNNDGIEEVFKQTLIYLYIQNILSLNKNNYNNNLIDKNSNSNRGFYLSINNCNSCKQCLCCKN
jgi:small GTP-binding protein